MNRTVENPQIGNWYLVDGKPTLVTYENIAQVHVTLCQPIPLTDGILRGNHFTSLSGEEWQYYDNTDLVVVNLNGVDRHGVVKRTRYISVHSRGADSSLIRYYDDITVDQLQDVLQAMAVNLKIEL